MPVIQRFYLPVLMFGAILSIFGCFKKKSDMPKDVESWLELHFPQQFEVLSSGSNFDIGNFFSGKRQSVLAERADSAVQFVIYWQKGVANFELTTTAIEQAYQAAKVNTQRSRDFYKQLKDKGLEQFSIGMNGGQAYLLMYAEPDRNTRAQVLSTLKSILEKQQKLPADNFQVSYMEPSAYQSEFKEIIPNWNWNRPDGWYKNVCILSLEIDASKGMDLEKLGRQWTINDLADRTELYRTEAFKHAAAWAEQHVSKPFHLDPDLAASFEAPLKDPMSIRYRFAYYKTEAETQGDNAAIAEPIGYVSVLYQADEKTCSKILKEDQ